jgi:hypothetical protein
MDDPSNKRRSPSALGPGSQATLLSGSVGLPCRSLVGAALPKTPYRDWKRGVDLSRSPTRRRMTGISAKQPCAESASERDPRSGSPGAGRLNPETPPPQIKRNPAAQKIGFFEVPCRSPRRERLSRQSPQTIRLIQGARSTRPASQKHARQVAVPVTANLTRWGASTWRQASAMATRTGGWMM